MSRITAENGSLSLSGRLNLTTLMAYRRDLQDYLPFKEDQVVDLSNLEVEGSAVLALLVRMVRQARRSEVELKFIGASDRLKDMASLAGIAELLHLDAA